MLDKICAKMPNLDGSQGCSVAEKLTTLNEIVERCGFHESEHSNLGFLFEEICSKCIITRSLNIAKELYPCQYMNCDGSGKVYEDTWMGRYDCPDCHGLGIARDAFWEKCGRCEGVGKVKNEVLMSEEMVCPDDFSKELREIRTKACHKCNNTGQIHCEPWPVVVKIRTKVCTPEIIRELKGQFFQLFWLWDRLRDLIGEVGDGREE